MEETNDDTSIPIKKDTRERLKGFVGKTWNDILNNLMDKAEALPDEADKIGEEE